MCLIKDMKVLVTYMSHTGNTKKVAKAIFGEIACEKEIKNIDDVNSLEGYNLTFVGFPVHRFGPDAFTRKFLKDKCRGKKIALFITHASPEDHEALPDYLDKFKEASDGAELVGVFNCQGQLAKGVRFVMKMVVGSQLRRFEIENDSRGLPDEPRIERARVFTRDIMNKIS